jgi:hypothetical protein
VYKTLKEIFRNHIILTVKETNLHILIYNVRYVFPFDCPFYIARCMIISLIAEGELDSC